MNFFVNTSLWQQSHGFMFISSKFPLNPSGKVFGFDLDGTLTTAKNGLDPKRSKQISSDNWLFLGPIKEKLKELSKDYSIFIITNQSKVSQIKLDMIASVYLALDGLPTILCANIKNEYRKPNTGFINVIRLMLANNNIDFNQMESYYSGDGVGETDPFAPYRWGTVDYDFAINSGLRFVRPSDIFGHADIHPTEELVMMMGTPGSLKTTFAKRLEHVFGYVRYSQDEITYKDLEKHKDRILSDIMSGKKVVLDATFAKEEKRLFWIRLIKEINDRYGSNIRVRILWSIRPGYCFNDERSKETRVSHFAYTGPNGYVPNFVDPYNAMSTYKYEVSQLY